MQADSNVAEISPVAMASERTDRTGDTSYCDFESWLWHFDSVPNDKKLQKLIANDRSLEYLGNNAGFSQFQKVKKEIIANRVLAKNLQLPPNALIIEKKQLGGVNNRMYILWTEDAMVGFEMDEIYTCPQVTIGTGYFQGKTRVSLINTKNRTIINTIPVIEAYWEGGVTDCFVIPFSIANPKYRFEIGQLKYHAIGGDSVKDGRAELLFLDDYTGDGKKFEFALYNQDGCVSCATTLFGYNEKSDRLVNYPVILEETDLDSVENGSTTTKSVWVDHMFTFRPRQGVYNFTINYRGRNGPLCNYNVKFNEENDWFEGKLETTNNDSIGYSWISYPEQKE